MNYPPQMPLAQPPRKKGMSGCMIALLVVGIVGFVGVTVTGIGAYLFATSDVGKTTIKVLGDGTKLAQKGLNAPGTAELRALGCDQAMVMDMKDVSALLDDMLDGGFVEAGADGVLVTCQMRRSSGPSCDDVASTYVRAVGAASGEFMVTVQRSGDHDPVCQSSYDKTGALVGSGPTGTTTRRGR